MQQATPLRSARLIFSRWSIGREGLVLAPTRALARPKLAEPRG